MRTLLIDERDMPVALDEAIRRSLCACFPGDREAFSRSRAWHGSLPAFTTLIVHGGQVVAHVGVVDRAIRVGDTPLRVAGVQNVFVLASFRGRGLADQVLIAAMDEAGRRRLDAGLLFCIPPLEAVYARTGWRRLDDRPVTRVLEDGTPAPLPGKNIAMFHPLVLQDFPDGPIHLGGNDW